MLPYPQLSRWMIIGCVLFSVISSADAGDSKALTRQAKAAIRAAENTNDAQLKNTKLDEARKLIDQIKAVDPQNVELKTIESKYRYMDTGREATEAAARTPEVDTGKLKEVLADWNAIIKLDKDLYAKTNRFFPHSGSMSYTKEQTDQVLSVIDDVMSACALKYAFCGTTGNANTKKRHGWKSQRRPRVHLRTKVTSPAETGRIIPFNYWKRRVPIPIPS